MLLRGVEWRSRVVAGRVWGLMLRIRVRMLRGEFSEGREELERCGCIASLLGGEVDVEFFISASRTMVVANAYYRPFSD